jgi:Leucine-rich repeat (LRR) protein
LLDDKFSENEENSNNTTTTTTVTAITAVAPQNRSLRSNSSGSLKKDEDEIPCRDRLNKALAEADTIDSVDLSTHVKKGEKLGEADFYKLSRCINLKTLNLAGQDAVANLPDNISSLTKLESINISKCHLKQVPQALCALTNMSELILRLNGLKAWPTEVNRLRLRRLDLAFNDIATLKLTAKGGTASLPFFKQKDAPSPIFSALRVLDLSFNQLTSFPVQGKSKLFYAYKVSI